MHHDPPGPDHPVPDLPLADELSAVSARVTGLLLSEETVATALGLVSSMALDTVPGAVGAGVSIVDERGRRSSGSTDARVERADALQYELDEGPCLTAWRTRELVRIDDTTTDARWPRWNEAAGSLGVRSVLSAPLIVAGESLGAMKVYCERPLNYGSHDEQIMRLLAGQAAILLANTQSLQEARRLSRRLSDALAGRDVLAQAIGVLLAQGAASRQDSFVALATAARRAGRPVEDVARALLTAVVARNTGASPDGERLR